ncbi:MAG: sugar phosphate isomerase/epimerase, partial [Clostridiales bacterium]|nr:sugar phosphate isomerase/epimerase [Clostridiales bacterium]
ALGEEYSAAFPLFYGDREVSKGQIAKYVRFREVVRMFRDSGVKLVVHGSGYGYLNDYKGRLVIEGMLEEANADPELDTCWMILGGVDVEKYIRKYRGRVDLLHLKDFKPPYEESEYVIVRQNSIENRWRECYTAVGQDGVLDLPRVVKTAVECGTKWLIVELWNERESLENACVSAENIRRYL